MIAGAPVRSAVITRWQTSSSSRQPIELAVRARPFRQALRVILPRRGLEKLNVPTLSTPSSITRAPPSPQVTVSSPINSPRSRQAIGVVLDPEVGIGEPSCLSPTCGRSRAASPAIDRLSERKTRVATMPGKFIESGFKASERGQDHQHELTIGLGLLAVLFLPTVFMLSRPSSARLTPPGTRSPTRPGVAVLGAFLPRFDPVLNVAAIEIPGAAHSDHRNLAAVDDVP